MNDVERRAADVIGSHILDRRVHVERLAAELADAGLLVTPLHEQALALAKRCAEDEEFWKEPDPLRFIKSKEARENGK